MQLDVTDRKAVFGSVDKAVERFGRIDVLISNAGLGHFGSVEEMTEEDMRGQMNTNFWGVVSCHSSRAPHNEKTKFRTYPASYLNGRSDNFYLQRSLFGNQMGTRRIV